MNSLELLDIISSGETSRVQFKKQLNNQDGFAAEMIAMANSKGGDILIGVEDKTGKVVGLDYRELQSIGSTIANIATNLVKPQIFPTTEVVNVDMGREVKKVLVVHVEEGIAKPYKDRNGTIWIKQGSDKRRLTDNNEQLRLFQHSGLVYIDEMIVPGTSVSDIDKDKVEEYLKKIEDSDTDIPEEQLYVNLNILKEGQMTLGGLLFFAKDPQKYRPAFCIKAVSFFGNDIAGNDYRGSKDIIGTIPELFEQAMGFFNTYLEHKQKDQNFNTTGQLEISPVALEELLQNALTHRDYSKNAPVRLLIFDDRVEIISPGALPNSLTVENIKMGNTVVRNNLVVSFSSKLMKYRGLGSGVRRALKEHPDTELINDTDGEQFISVLKRE
ncbi:MAG: putative DNA binding domain-containing protein [Fermentimonas sp.]|nr:putative DNA binding domain-containing protein [Fermentimonas sp.]MDD4698292.1 putative DNA binding domain-containing protein [Fermentimonas sp.]